MLDGIAGAAPVAAAFRDLPSSFGVQRQPSVATMERARDDVVQFADAKLVNVGFVLEMTRAAAAQRNVAFFADPAAAPMLARIAALPGVRSRAPNEVGWLQAQTGSTANLDWERVERTASELIRLLAR